MTSVELKTQIETGGKIFDLNVIALVKWTDGRAYVETDTLDFEFIDPEDDTSENYELICKYLDDNYDTFRANLEDLAEENGEPIGWNA
jgi:hypothetical protein